MRALDSQEFTEHPDIDGIIKGLEAGSLKQVAQCMGNVLEDVTIPMYPVIDQIKQEMLAAGACRRYDERERPDGLRTF